ncbi:MAG TPA: HAMP domain-containing sensor histidine kinase [Bacteroidales bacterium]|mgnify:CR=1 FL=1|nr:HAMP domain-containing sensor histidine kinase [Bacteroidales bacterium]HPI87352.1 HAMP domain-containing sensor histidine kinase [Bacteroidales bacterium]HPM91293.1 HAMP domain-containing sensor histidine kinase [Bacteroidales bacterium]
MKQRTVIFAVIMLSIALTGLMIIQGYWIHNAYKVKHANFIRTVNESAHSVILVMEKLDLVRKLQQPRLLGGEEFPAVAAVDSINQVLLFEMQKIRTRKDLEVFFNKYFMARELMEDRIFSHSIQDNRQPVDLPLVDSLLSNEFAQRNLNTEWSFGIHNPASDILVFNDEGIYSAELLNPEIGFHFELYPDDMLDNPDFLLLYFPHERQYLLGQVWPLVLISIILVIIIISSFIYTLIMYFRQNRLSELKTDFINNMTHEFKTPVSTISLACEALNDKDIKKSEELYQAYINIINEENKRLGLMAERILQSAALEKGDLVLHREVFDIHDILHEAIRNIGIQVEIKDGQIIKDFQAGRSVIEADRMHLVNIVQNLLDNANKYTPVKPQIIVGTKDAANGIIFTVQDNGIGISKADQKKIFEKLYRVPEGNVHNFKGFGLGLSYVKTVVERHGGYIRLDSELKKGTRFEVFLPDKSK